MTIQQAIDNLSIVQKHQYPTDMLVTWLSNLDQQIYRDLIKGHVLDVEEPERYDAEDLSTELLVPDPYTEMYVKYLCMQVDYYNNEIDRYNNSNAAFTQALDNYGAWLNRTHRPEQPSYVRI